MERQNENQQKGYIAGQDLVAFAPISRPTGTEFSTLYMYAPERGKEHFRAHPGSHCVHLRIFLNDVEVAITDDPRHVYVAGTQFWLEGDTYSIYNEELDVTITAPHGFYINIELLTPAINKLLTARNIIDSAKLGNISDNHFEDDGLQVLITVVSENYSPNYTLFECPGTTSVVVAQCRRGDLGKIDGNGYQKDDFKASFDRLMDLHHMWIYVRVLLGYDYPYVTNFKIGDSTVEWSGISEENNAA